jgi:acetyl-CoA carboxylase biotin carboxylase subunit
VTSLDVVRAQVQIAAGASLPLGGRAPRQGHAIEVRVNAEDPSRGFAPAPGVIERFRPPLGPGVRVDTFLEEGLVVPPHYDSLLAKVVVWDETRPAAIARAVRALRELEVRGVPTTRDVAIEILESREFRSGDYSTSFLEEAGGRLAALGAA